MADRSRRTAPNLSPITERRFAGQRATAPASVAIANTSLRDHGSRWALRRECRFGGSSGGAFAANRSLAVSTLSSCRAHLTRAAPANALHPALALWRGTVGWGLSSVELHRSSFAESQYSGTVIGVLDQARTSVLGASQNVATARYAAIAMFLAEGVRFELTVPLRVRRFSRPVP